MKRTAYNIDAEYGFLCMNKKEMPYNVLMHKNNNRVGYVIIEAFQCDGETCKFPDFPYYVTQADRRVIKELTKNHEEVSK